MSDFLNKYPYTDFHELNLDWILSTIKQLVKDWEEFHTTIEGEWSGVEEDWRDVEDAWISLKNYVENYFNNLDVQQEINNKLDQMVADGTLDAILLPYFNQYKVEINTIVANYKNSTDTILNTQNGRITILENRMDGFASLPPGSTAGNAELLDIRIGANGQTYNSAGDAVRANDERNHNTLLTISDTDDHWIPVRGVFGLGLANYDPDTGQAYYDNVPGFSYDHLTPTPGEVYKINGSIAGTTGWGVIFTDASSNVIEKYYCSHSTSPLSFNDIFVVPPNTVNMYFNYLEEKRIYPAKPFGLYKYITEKQYKQADLSNCSYQNDHAYIFYNDINPLVHASIISLSGYGYIKIPVNPGDAFKITMTSAGVGVSDAMFVNNNDDFVSYGHWTWTTDPNGETKTYETCAPLNSNVSYMVLCYLMKGKNFSICQIVEHANTITNLNEKIAILGDSRSDFATFPYTWTVHLDGLIGFDSLYVDAIGGTCISLDTVYGYSILNRASSIPVDSSTICIYAGINDFANDVPLGTISDNTASTFYGAMNLLINYIQTNYPTAVLCFITPEKVSDAHMAVNGLGLYVYQYVDAMINTCKKYKVPFLNHFETCGVNPENATQAATMFTDGVHATAIGNMIYAKKIGAYIKSIV